MGLRAHFFFQIDIHAENTGVNARSRSRDERTRESGEFSEVRPVSMGAPDLHSLVERTIGPLGYELVDIEFGPRGLLRVFIDSTAGIQIEDCEAVSRQLSHVFTVDDIDYGRLEVSSPGLDRKLKSAVDFERFAGFEADLRLRETLNGRRRFVGVLSQGQNGKFALDYEGGRLEFTADEVERARLVPKL